MKINVLSNITTFITFYRVQDPVTHIYNDFFATIVNSFAPITIFAIFKAIFYNHTGPTKYISINPFNPMFHFSENVRTPLFWVYRKGTLA